MLLVARLGGVLGPLMVHVVSFIVVVVIVFATGVIGSVITTIILLLLVLVIIIGVVGTRSVLIAALVTVGIFAGKVHLAAGRISGGLRPRRGAGAVSGPRTLTRT